MIFDIFAIEKGVAFRFSKVVANDRNELVLGEPEKDAPTFHIRPIETFMARQQRIYKRRSETTYDHATGKTQIVEQDASPEEREKEYTDMMDHMLASWDDKVLDANGNPIPVTQENKFRLLEIPAVMRFVIKCSGMLDDAYVKMREVTEKN